VVDLLPEQLGIVRDVLGAHVPAGRAFAFGSRVRGTAKRFSDLDLVVDAAGPLDLDRLGALRAAFSDSDLPIKVDIVDWSGLGATFRSLIEREMVPVYP
jgi:type I restriction enzyme S subunit